MKMMKTYAPGRQSGLARMQKRLTGQMDPLLMAIAMPSVLKLAILTTRRHACVKAKNR